MTTKDSFEVIIIGGSYAGLSAAMALGRSLRNVLVIDSGKPCNIQTPHSHNFITQDGQTPAAITSLAKEQVAKYDTIHFYAGLATSATKTENGFQLQTQSGDNFTAKRLLFATGIRDSMPDITGFSTCWGISVIHCPYCHGYEVRNGKTGVLANGDTGFEMARMISHWTSDLTLLTNGRSTLTAEQTEKLSKHHIRIIETRIDHLRHRDGHLQDIVFKDGSTFPLPALYARVPFIQHCSIPADLGCQLTPQGLLAIDAFQQTTVTGVYACGDNSSQARSVSASVAAGTLAGAFINRELIEEAF